MSDIKLFRYTENGAIELSGKAALIEKQLQILIEAQMGTFLGIRFLATEYSTGKTHKGRIDSLGLDENGCPVIIEYKRHSNENVINQGLFYLDWLLDHKAEFSWLVMEKLGKRPVVPPVLTPPKQSSLLFFNEDEQWPYQNSGSIISKPGTVAV
jgi:hypothetical protein